MSKESALRAMREARYERQAARPATTPRLRPPVAPTTPPSPPAEAAAPTVDEGLCGHRSMNGRTCTREHGHAAKSHRYG
ncbi:hypothetical protein G5V58_24210 [Nocardioides anomalus]|uniref:Uncharacterized protein n=1 Tax=Nocardioides anomalus TaxID=2712223 RepID=A0A6G6WK44_9ACTN|nr:hypothetical protein [Nocardioides anomalus]QIG45440.1 hypothetical protein G5V58_24210 [Nocardioides anomalus]